MWWVEVIGIVSTLFILVSMSINTQSYKGDVWMRIINLIGSAIFIVYGALLPAISTAVLNGCLVFVNSYHLWKLVSDHKKEVAGTQSKTEEQPKTQEETK